MTALLSAAAVRSSLARVSQRIPSLSTTTTTHTKRFISMTHSSSIPPPPATRKLEAKDGPLVWIDCEMTGLDLKTDRIIEIACIITDGQLQPLDEGVNYVVRTDKSVLDAMGSWCVYVHCAFPSQSKSLSLLHANLPSPLSFMAQQTSQHGKSGLTKACLDPERSYEHDDVYAAVLTYVRDRVPQPYLACLAGNTVHADAKFLEKEMPELISHLHYRIVDVSTIKELVGRWYGGDKRYYGGKGNHRALDDIQTSIVELQHYRKRFFTKE